ncbi:ATP-binding cassette domain-containing protein [Streptomyces sp. NBC_01381]|uniref:ATP-binding cassette domain-containing protein n=1 Tax=Streptomyces sp. NBC_01381 TaxID=2903845 RepID=UPI002252DF06|nr:ATP-binding cassette domain-containing protein [Streptomyces sp. NBC_01381]MCX4670514.1 ATP-binding cassette domain-containing protein [Streptomyces sp. NBC_01381]
MIQAIGLTSNARQELPPAVDDVSFEARTGCVTALLGARAAGKTTALRLMLELQQGRGVTYFRGRPLHRITHPSREVGVLLGEVPGHPARTVRGQLRMLCAAAGVPVRRADDVLEVVGLVSLRDQRLGMLSRGMDRRLGLACALLADPHTLVLDGPADGLSAREGGWLHGILRAHAAQGGTVLFSTDDPKEAARTADRVVTLEAGRLVADQEVGDFARTRLRPRVAVRSPHAARLGALLSKEARAGQRSIEVVKEDGNRLSVYGSNCADVGETAFRHGILVHQLADEIGDAGPSAVSRTEGGPSESARSIESAAPEDSIDRADADRQPASEGEGGDESGRSGESPLAAAPRAAAGEPRLEITATGVADPRLEAAAPRAAVAAPEPEIPATRAAAVEPEPDTAAALAAVADPRLETAGPRAAAVDPRFDRAVPQASAADPQPEAAAPQATAADPQPQTAVPPAAMAEPQPEAEPKAKIIVPLAAEAPQATDSALAPSAPRSQAPMSPLPPPISVRPSRGPLRPLRYELRRAAGVGTGYLAAAAVLAVSAIVCVFLARSGHTPQSRLLAAWPQELPLPPAALGAGLLGALAFGEEFRHPALAADRGTVPRRLGLLCAKLLVAAGTALLLGLLVVAADAAVLHLVYGYALTEVPADWLSLSASWVALVVGCAWAGVLAGGVFRSTAAGLAAVVAVPIVVVPLVQKALEGPSVRSAAGLPGRLRDLALVQWPFGVERYLAGGVRMIAQPVGSALMLSLTALLCAFLLTTMRSRVR